MAVIPAVFLTLLIDLIRTLFPPRINHEATLQVYLLILAALTMVIGGFFTILYTPGFKLLSVLP